jgi:hypothetical protein
MEVEASEYAGGFRRGVELMRSAPKQWETEEVAQALQPNCHGCIKSHWYCRD